ncbi:NosR/NirI family protein [Cupriavidus taiwanensis]|uniref:NosR/NirI family protein n=1 Tax=Cupriavidus taiwanensis TaxID=164546 RepID=UPI000E2FDC7A|nr:NosR/NirI family protein [Cupriavidus taiwanensis]
MQAIFKGLVAVLAAWLLSLGLVSPSHAGAYEAELPPQLATAPDLCALVPCAQVLPGATNFSSRMGQPPYVEGYRTGPGGKRELLGYVMLSTDITDTPAYSGKPVVTLIGMDTQGRYAGIRVLKHSEPILLLGIPEAALLDFNRQYVGKSVADKIEVGQSRPDEGVVGVDAISGATVTVIAQNQVLTTAGAAVARQVGILAPTRRAPARYVESGTHYSWSQLVAMGAVQRLLVQPAQVGLSGGLRGGGGPFIELWFGDLNHPDIARSVLGDAGWQGLRAQLRPGEHAIFVIRTAGTESFKGSGFVRGGIYDRVQVRQDADAFTFRDLDYLNLYGVAAPGAPAPTESAIFVIRSPAFSAAYPWKLSFLGNRVDRASGTRSFASFDAPYWLPAALLQGGRPQIDVPDAPWRKVWRRQAGTIALFVALLGAVTLVYALRDRLTRRATHKNKWPVNAFKYTAWAISIGLVGFGAMAQPSITQVLTWFHALLLRWDWALFLSDPFIFCFWIFIIVTVLLFGRGLFCGWLCPFGSLSEALYKLGRFLGLKRWQRQLPRRWHERLKWLKYGVFWALLAVSVFSMGLAEKLAEIEPFKTTFLVGIANRAWPYGLFACALLGLSLFVERPYCKYLCPLGAALAMPSTFRWFGLRRKPDCNRCKACAAGCGAQAIDADGRIDPRECLHCLDCMVLYTDTHGCPPLARERKRRERDGLPLTPVGRDGYFIPLVPVTAAAAQPSGPDPRMPTDPVTPPYAETKGVARCFAELWDHLWPWSGQGWRSAAALQLAGVAVALAVTVAWALAASGQLRAGAVIGWWLGWSLYEVLIRLSAKRYVKDGPWWRARYRRATVMDMLSYVGFKNLLIGAALFLALKTMGMLAA